MKKLLILCIIICSAQLSTAQWFGNKSIRGNGDVITKTFDTGEYEAITVAGSMDVTLVPGTEGKVTVKAESNIMEYLKIETDGDKLIIGTKKNSNISPRRSIIVTVPVKTISEARVSGSGEIFSSMMLKARVMRFKVAGSGDIELTVEAENVKASVTGSGDMVLTGRTENLEVSVTGSGDIKTTNLKANNVEAKVTGSGDIAVMVNGGNFKGYVSGSGDIRYKGKIKKVYKSVTGSGDIEKM